ncbi:unnamed protein product [Didymodactylos carnosus]|uniref:Uncharacterized protein n=1 Tax=Didymodactylos carnosus TaxID=1234261 RepID=A0A815I3N3_9BILA|nr:unnamed protein product [Didymodactylos carnosus]CAF1360996.1 unnamed protein product [Didymodactylos carnosus]CAF3517421.1 unnamed protein product [Didymodactylos carnosus]CAF4239327.1 unnamed protein product [Didymodactylos carnosus]
MFCLVLGSVMLVTIQARRVANDDNFEISNSKARSFLDDSDDNDADDLANYLLKRASPSTAQKDCVMCKFNMVPCCKPNICIKKTLRPDECMEIKTGK